MLFNSLAFAFFLPVVFGLYWWLGRGKQGIQRQNLLLLVSSYVFYGWWDPRFLSLIFLSSLTDYLAGMQMGQERRKDARKPWLVLSLAVNLGMLGFFKYGGFFLENFAAVVRALGLD